MEKQIYNDSFYYSKDNISYFITNLTSGQVRFFMDISSRWWQTARNADSQIRKYIEEKFARDFYPRVVAIGNKQFDIDYEFPKFKADILSMTSRGQYTYEYEQEKTIQNSVYSLQSGVASLVRETKLYNPRIAITFSDVNMP